MARVKLAANAGPKARRRLAQLQRERALQRSPKRPNERKEIHRPNKKEEHRPQDDDDQIYMVERILESRVNDGVIEYFVKWEGYDSCDNQWITADMFVGPAAIEEFEREQAEAQKRSPPRPQKRRILCEDDE